MIPLKCTILEYFSLKRLFRIFNFKLNWDNRNPVIKLRWLGFQNQIVGDSDSKPSEFGRWYSVYSDSIVKIVSPIANSTDFLSISIKIDHFWSLLRLKLITFWLKDQKRWLKCQLKDWKSQYLIKIFNTNWLFQSVSIAFNHYQSLSLSFRTFRLNPETI